jgi:hypothetical protein
MIVATAGVVLVSHLTARAWAAEPEGKPEVVGRIDFDDASLPPANVEIDLGEGMVSDLFGIGDAALEGVIDALSQNTAANEHPQSTQMAAEQLQAARQILDLAGDAVQEVRVRAYEQLPEGAFEYFDSKLKDGQWETLVRARKGDENVRVALVRDKGAVNGVFVIASDGGGLVVVNAVCDISPENVKKLTSAATRIGLENGLAEAINQQMRRMNHRLPPVPVQPAVEKTTK